MKKLLYIVLFLGFSIIQLSAFSQKAQLKGKVIDASNNEPVPFANVLVVGTQIGSTTDFDGNFIITGLNPGYVKLRVSFVGYKTTYSADILLSNNNTPFIEVRLEPSSQKLQQVVVSVDPFEKKQEAPLSMQSIGTKQIESNPGSNRDISKVIQSFPGVGSTPAFRNDIIIRGGGPSENSFYLDGVEIPILNHFDTQGASGGPVGIINADFIQFVDFYSGSFPVNASNALSGVMDFKLKDGNKDKANYQFSLGASEAAFTLDGPIGEKTSMIFSVRRSYLQFLFSILELPFLPTFNDYQFKVKTQLNQNNQITLIGLGSLDKLSLNTGIDNPDASQEFILSQTPVNNQWSYTTGLVYQNFFDKGSHRFILSRNMLNNQFYKYPNNNESLAKSFDYLSSEAENKFRYELNFRNKGIKYLFGTSAEYTKYYNKTTQQIFINDSLINFAYETNLDVISYGLFGQASKYFFGDRLLANLGLRLDANNYNASTENLLNQISPRFSLSYSLSEKTKINAGLGRYFQNPTYTTLGYRDNQGVLVNENAAKYIGANHYNLGIQQLISKEILLSVEAFYKDYFQYPIDLRTGASLANQGAEYSSVAGAAAVDFIGKGQAVGFEVLNRVNFKDFNLLASYTYVRSLFSDINGDLIPSAWDSKHLLTITSSKDFQKNWRVGLKWRFVGGLPYTPYDLETSANVLAWDANGQAYLDFKLLNTERFKPFHQLDIRVDKSFFFDKWTFMLYVDIQNAYNFQSDGKDYIIREKNPDGSYLTINGGSEYVLKAVENSSGTLLPTLGIMIKL
ncbi:MAG TPA: TonB-dependent receptor [Bacteroidetes bacterium]|nr:TonB-dependent receptor [Bacteroidota bacterium]